MGRRTGRKQQEPDQHCGLNNGGEPVAWGELLTQQQG